MAYTLAQVRDLVRQRCDLEVTTAQTDAELDNHIRDAVTATHEYLCSAMGDTYFVLANGLATTPGVADYPLGLGMFGGGVLPTVYRLLAVKLKVGDDHHVPLRPYSKTDTVQRITGAEWGGQNLPRYSLNYVGDTATILTFDPPPNAAHVITYWFQPLILALFPITLDTDLIPVTFPDLVVVEACLRVKDKEERDVTRLMQERSLIQQRIVELSNNVDHANPPATIMVPRRYDRGRRLYR